jgi:23S rRNA pseudouridine1911/1915/1917 synthase
VKAARPFAVKQQTSLLDFLLTALHGKSRTGVKALIQRRLVQVGEKIVTDPRYPLKPGESVRVLDRAPATDDVLKGLKILHDDASVVVIEKAAGLLSVPDDAGKKQFAQDILAKHLGIKIFAVHRLDRDTSGVMMFVKDKEAQRHFRQDWQELVPERRYSVVVEGNVVKDAATLTAWLEGTGDLRTYTARPGEGQKAVLRYRVLQRKSGYSLVDVELETGRKNQIRVQLAAIGHPVVGDIKYGAKADPLRRLGLHARTLGFIHPVSGKKMLFESPTPREFMRLVGE